MRRCSRASSITGMRGQLQHRQQRRGGRIVACGMLLRLTASPPGSCARARTPPSWVACRCSSAPGPRRSAAGCVGCNSTQQGRGQAAITSGWDSSSATSPRLHAARRTPCSSRAGCVRRRTSSAAGNPCPAVPLPSTASSGETPFTRSSTCAGGTPRAAPGYRLDAMRYHHPGSPLSTRDRRAAPPPCAKGRCFASHPPRQRSCAAAPRPATPHPPSRA